MDELDKAKLIEIAKKKLKEPKKVKASSDIELVNKFIISENIKAHDKITVPAFIIYDRYVNWAKINGQKTFNYRFFGSLLGRFFAKKNNRTGIVYFVDPTGFNLNPTYVESVKQKWILPNGKKEKKEKE